MGYIEQPPCQMALNAILARNPRASLDDIRRSHALLGRMSPDRLGLMLAQTIDKFRARRLK
jgi:hypothetical protein